MFLKIITNKYSCCSLFTKDDNSKNESRKSQESVEIQFYIIIVRNQKQKFKLFMRSILS